jgi:hypothetical protein
MEFFLQPSVRQLHRELKGAKSGVNHRMLVGLDFGSHTSIDFGDLIEATFQVPIEVLIDPE